MEFEAANAFPSSVDDAEFYFTPGDALVQFRCARRDGPTDFGASRRRMDGIRVALKFESVRVQTSDKVTDRGTQSLLPCMAVVSRPAVLDPRVQPYKGKTPGGSTVVLNLSI